MQKFTIKLFVALLLTGLLAQPSYAAYINEWSYTLTYAFDSYENQWGNTYGLTESNSGHTLNWGVNGTSSIGFTDANGTVTTNDPSTDFNIIHHLYHDNQPIDGDSPILQSGTLSATLTLKGYDPVSNTEQTFDTVLQFLFFETSNRYPNGSARNNDVFILMNPQAATQDFTYDGWDYTFSFLSGFGELGQEDLEDMDMVVPSNWWPYNDTYRTVYSLLQDPNSDYYYPGQDYYGWTTAEGQRTYLDSLLTITSEMTPVPEPSTFAFLGLGMLALAFVGRKMRRSA